MGRREILRYIPRFSKLLSDLRGLGGSHDLLTTENRQLKNANRRLNDENRRMANALHAVLFASETSLVDDPMRSPGERLPLPAAGLRYLVAGTEDLEWFLQLGKQGAETVVRIVGRQGKTLDQFKRILDFGCGCGRVIRYLNDVPTGELYGADCNPKAVQWCQKHLPFATFTVNVLEPPLSYRDGMFDLVYAFSIFTHLTEPLQTRWMEELRRVMVPGGYLLISLHGDKYLEVLSAAELAEYQKGNLVVRDENVAGTNRCGAFHPESYVRRVLARGFDVVDFVPEGAKGNPPQDAYLLKSRS